MGLVWVIVIDLKVITKAISWEEEIKGQSTTIGFDVLRMGPLLKKFQEILET